MGEVEAAGCWSRGNALFTSRPIGTGACLSIKLPLASCAIKNTSIISPQQTPGTRSDHDRSVIPQVDRSSSQWGFALTAAVSYKRRGDYMTCFSCQPPLEWAVAAAALSSRSPKSLVSAWRTCSDRSLMSSALRRPSSQI